MEKLILQELSQILTEIPFNRMLGFNVDAIEDDQIIMSFHMKPDLVGNIVHGILHGGVISSVIDMAGGVAAIAMSVRKHKDKEIAEIKAILGKVSTINLHINYLCPGKGSRFIATAWVLRSGNKICFTRSELRNEENVLIATGAGTYLVG
ncbi:MAG: thioesterase family protein [Gammaproteobacteria bacterium]